MRFISRFLLLQIKRNERVCGPMALRYMDRHFTYLGEEEALACLAIEQFQRLVPSSIVIRQDPRWALAVLIPQSPFVQDRAVLEDMGQLS